MVQIPLLIATGWLGSGKTTLLKKLLECHADKRRIAVIQNEFAPTGIDGRELRGTGKSFRLLELNRGSVFCVCLFSDFSRAMNALIEEYKPAAVVLEATGLADPIAVAQLLEAPELRQRVYLGRIWCLVDASAYAKYARSAKQVFHQIRVADIILLNKCDRAGKDEIERIKNELNALNPFAPIELTTYSSTDFEHIFDKPTLGPVAGRIIDEKPAPRPQLATVVLRRAGVAARSELECFLRHYASDIWRMKGFVACREGLFSVQLSYGDLEIRPSAAGCEGAVLTALGANLDAAALRAGFARLFRSRS